MRGPCLALLFVAACAQAGSSQNDATQTDTRPIDATIDGNGCTSQPCTILPQCGCGGANTCDIDPSDLVGTSCRAVNMMGRETSSCDTFYECDKGYVCLGTAAYGSCKKY